MPPTTFTDAAGRTWNLRLDINAIRRVRDAHGVDLAKVIGHHESTQTLLGDIILLVDVIYSIIEPAAMKAGIDSQSFGEGLAGDALGHAIEAFENAMVDFVPESRRRTLLRQTVDGAKACQAQMALRVGNSIEELIRLGIEEEMRRIDSSIEQQRQRLSGTATGS